MKLSILDVDPIATTFPSADHLQLKSHERLIQSLNSDLEKNQQAYNQLKSELTKEKERTEKRMKELAEMEEVMLL